MIILTIDTSSNKEIKVTLVIDGKEKGITQKIGPNKAQVILPLIDKLIIKHKITLSDVHSIEVNTGPGSFTGLRVGIAVANALSFALKIPVNRSKVGQFEQPRY